MTFALETIGLQKHFGGLAVTRDLSLQVKTGARHALIGPNGAGKTTVINLLTGVLRPNAGRIVLEGSDITALPVHRRVLRGLSRTFQINQLYPDLTPLETIGLAVSERLGHGSDWWRVLGTRADVNGEIAEHLARFHLLDVMNERTATLPYGKQRLLEIAVRAVCIVGEHEAHAAHALGVQVADHGGIRVARGRDHEPGGEARWHRLRRQRHGGARQPADNGAGDAEPCERFTVCAEGGIEIAVGPSGVGDAIGRVGPRGACRRFGHVRAPQLP